MGVIQMVFFSLLSLYRDNDRMFQTAIADTTTHSAPGVLEMLDALSAESVRFANIRFLGASDCPIVIAGFTPDGGVFGMEHHPTNAEEKSAFFSLAAVKFAMEGVDRFTLVMRVWTTRMTGEVPPSIASDREEMLLVLSAHVESVSQVLIPVKIGDGHTIVAFGDTADRRVFLAGDVRRPHGVHDLLKQHRNESIPESLQDMAQSMYEEMRIDFCPGMTRMLYN